MAKIDNAKNIRWVFLGTDDFSVAVLNELKKVNFLPCAIITAPDKPSGRGQKIQKPAVKIWAEKNLPHPHHAKIFQPTKLDAEFVEQLSTELSVRPELETKSVRGSKKELADIFVVASYGKIIPKSVLDLPKFGSLNVHPSLLPLYRGASPIESAMLDDTKETGVTIMLVDEEMDHGPIIGQEVVIFDEWPAKIKVEKKLAEIGGKLLAESILPFLRGEIIPQEQDHARATFTKKITKEMGEIKEMDEINLSEIKNLANDTNGADIARQNFLKIKALNPWPGAYFFIDHAGKKMRVKITDAEFVRAHDAVTNDAVTEPGSRTKLKVLKVIPEGRKEMIFEEFQRGFLGKSKA